jgi:hypothetical protein
MDTKYSCHLKEINAVMLKSSGPSSMVPDLFHGSPPGLSSFGSGLKNTGSIYTLLNENLLNEKEREVGTKFRIIP